MRKQILVAMATLMMFNSVMPVYAATITAGAGQTANAEQVQSAEQKSESEAQSNGITWLVPKGKTSAEYESEYGPLASDWTKAEAVAQVRKWADENKGDIPSTEDEKARYEAIVKKVCDFLEYDEVYAQPHVAFSIRDGKGVCAEYTAFTKALCDVCDIQSTILSGRIEGAGHDLLRVTLNGQTYYSDPTNVDYSNQPVLTDSIPSYFTYDYEFDPSFNGAALTGGSVDDTNTLDLEARKRGEVLLCTDSNGAYYGSEEDAIILDKAIEADDMDTIYSIFDKYGIPYTK